MSFLSRLRRKAPSTDPGRPASTAVSNEVSSERGELPRNSAPEPAAEVVSLPFGERLLQLAFDATNTLHRAAQKRLAELVDSGSVAIDQLPTDEGRQRVVLAIAASTTDATNFETVANRIADPAIWIELASQGATAKLRQLAAGRIETADALRAVMKAAKERDKNVYRIAKAKLDAFNAAAKRVEQARAHMRSLAETIERHSYKPFDNAYVAAIDHLEREWHALEVEIPEDLLARVASAIDRAREAIAERIRAAGAQAAHEAAVANAEPLRAATLDELRKILSALYAAEVFDAASAAGVNERVARLSERWNDTLQYKPASATEARELEDLRRAVQRLAQGLAEAGALPQQLQAVRSAPSDAIVARAQQLIADRHLLGDNVPATVLEAEAATKQWHDAQAAQRAAREDAERQVGQLIRKAQHALLAGQSRQAFGIRRSIDTKLEQLLGRKPEWCGRMDAQEQRANRPKHLLEKLQQLDAKLQEIQDWRSFAVTPKRSELIAQMQALIGSDDEPTQLAEEIKRLQEEWKSLAKGSADSDADWAKFHEAAQAAYAPCKAYFEAQAQARERNFEQRKALVARLTEYERATDWQHVDWKNVANALRSAKQEWRSAGPTERAATKPLEKQFDALLGRIQARLDTEYAANLERKQALVKQAQRLAGIDDLAQAANEVKRLQAAWRGVGLTPHAEGQRLWDELKQHCDAVFDKRRKQHTERMAELEQNEEQALALCIEVEGLAQRSGAELFAGAQRVRELRDAFARLGELPRDQAQEIQRRFRRAVEEYEHAIKHERQREADLAWDNFFDAVNRIRLQQLGPRADTQSALQQHIDSIERWPKGAKVAIERKLADPFDSDVTENSAALRAIAIRAEIATGAATPDADQSQRRTMQLQALVKGIGRTSASTREQLEALAFEWAMVGPVPNDVYEDLFARFKRCWTLAQK